MILTSIAIFHTEFNKNMDKSQLDNGMIKQKIYQSPKMCPFICLPKDGKYPFVHLLIKS